jgi:hypothetical protein
MVAWLLLAVSTVWLSGKRVAIGLTLFTAGFDLVDSIIGAVGDAAYLFRLCRGFRRLRRLSDFY